uniref:Uncharacterized protein n=1 Tax=Solanum lycopersicum TaxID=4081 RepID=A0A3Q7FAQ9_SOLLC
MRVDHEASSSRNCFQESNEVAAETVGWAVSKVTLQLREANMAARRRNGIKCPIPALGSRAI